MTVERYSSDESPESENQFIRKQEMKGSIRMIIYFSGTGNCQYVAEQIATAVDDKAVSVEDSDGKIDLKNGKILGIVFPTHFWEMPAICASFWRKRA